MFSTTLKLAGVTFPNKDGSSRQDLMLNIYDDYWTEDCEDELCLELRREPKNRHDKNAVAVWCTAPEDVEGQIGYLPAENAAAIGTAIKEGRFKGVEFTSMGCGRGNRVFASLKVKLLGENDTPQGEFDASHFFTDADGETYQII